MGPDTPLTRILELMILRLSLYQFVEWTNKPQTDLKRLKTLKSQNATELSSGGNSNFGNLQHQRGHIIVGAAAIGEHMKALE